MLKISQRDNQEEMEEHFEKRTNMHIGLVQKYLKKIQDLNIDEVDNDLLEKEMDHDASKFEEPEYTPYLHVNWKYKMKDDGKEYKPSEEIEKKMNDATFHHITNNKHHPDYWDENITPEALNSKDRDKPGKEVNATKMPLTYVAAMLADWAAMSEEKDTSIKDWIKKNVNVRWKFTDGQTDFINDLAKKIRPMDYKD